MIVRPAIPAHNAINGQVALSSAALSMNFVSWKADNTPSFWTKQRVCFLRRRNVVSFSHHPLNFAPYPPIFLYQVVADDGTVVHSSSSVDEGRIVRIAPFGEILKATGKVMSIDALKSPSPPPAPSSPPAEGSCMSLFGLSLRDTTRLSGCDRDV